MYKKLKLVYIKMNHGNIVQHNFIIPTFHPMKYLFGLFFSYFLLLPLAIQGQTLTYDVVWKGDTIGLITASRFDSASFSIYDIQSDVSIWFLGRKHLLNSLHSVYLGDDLISGNTTYHRNGALKEQTSIHKKNGAYVISNCHSAKATHDQHIRYSICKLYFEKPSGEYEVFSERFCQNLSINQDSPSIYTLTKPDDRINTYFYENGICNHVKVETFWATIHFWLRPA